MHHPLLDGLKKTTIIHWDGPLPEPGHWLRSTRRPRYAYQIVQITPATKPGVSYVAKALLDRQPADAPPADAVVHAWAWASRN